MTAPKWTEAEDEMLKYLTAKGWSSARISANLPGRGRNAIIGRQHRIGLKVATKPRAAAPSGMPLKPPRDYRDHATVNVSRLNRLRAEMEAAAKAQPAPKKPVDDAAPAPLMIPLIGLEPNMCRWPANSPERGGEFLFCAHEKERGSPYCSFHERIAWVGRPQARATRPMRRAA